VTVNNGNKWLFVNLFEASKYPTGGSAGGGSSLDSAIAVLGLDMWQLNGTSGTSNSNNPILVSAFPNGSGNTSYNSKLIPYSSTGAYVTYNNTSTYHSIELNNITLTVPGACSLFTSFKGDAWSSQANNGGTEHCSMLDFYVLSLNDPEVTYNFSCNSPFTQNSTNSLSFAVEPLEASALEFSAALWVDMDDNGILDKSVDAILINQSNQPVRDTSRIDTAFQNTPFIFGPVNYSTNVLGGIKNKDLFLEVRNIVFLENNRRDTLFNDSVVQWIENDCVEVLPIKLKTFDAKRMNDDLVHLEWLVNETGNDVVGYEVERLIGDEWVSVGKVQAIPYSSFTDKKYTYQDKNANPGQSIYRLKMITVSTSHYSKVVTVNGTSQNFSINLVQNPGTNGKTTFEIQLKNDLVDVIIMDVNGRVFNQFQANNSGVYSFENLNNGIYILKLNSTVTNQQVVEKVVVND
jgi:hypothetical protein